MLAPWSSVSMVDFPPTKFCYLVAYYRSPINLDKSDGKGLSQRLLDNFGYALVRQHRTEIEERTWPTREDAKPKYSKIMNAKDVSNFIEWPVTVPNSMEFAIANWDYRGSGTHWVLLYKVDSLPGQLFYYDPLGMPVDELIAGFGKTHKVRINRNFWKLKQPVESIYCGLYCMFMMDYLLTGMYDRPRIIGGIDLDFLINQILEDPNLKVDERNEKWFELGMYMQGLHKKNKAFPKAASVTKKPPAWLNALRRRILIGSPKPSST